MQMLQSGAQVKASFLLVSTCKTCYFSHRCDFREAENTFTIRYSHLKSSVTNLGAQLTLKALIACLLV